MARIVQHAMNWGKKRPRLFFSLMALLNLSVTLYNWHTLKTENSYYPVAAIVCPAGVILFGVAALFPGLSIVSFNVGQLKKRGPMHYLLEIVAVAAGLLNWYAMTR
ncbi:MAG TPA: hypothetical protein VK699_05935 [Terriglobales bacterium]|jgi:hypothetical protein|nr:hypothetical protein [Terriglobales bacterium]